MKKRIYALGFFDGVHMGHGALLRACREMADHLRCEAGAITFSDHPDGLVFGKAPGLLNTLADRIWLMQSMYGIDHVTVLPFDDQLMRMPWQDFFTLLLERHGAAGLVCGEGFRFGNGGKGNAQLLRQACESRGIPCEVVPQLRLDGVTVSSTHIRTLLENGELETAVRFLGHPHIISGGVVSGRHLGRTIGVPTANLLLTPGQLQPKFGVYACIAEFDGQSFPAVTNIGNRPTVGGRRVTVEPWILGYSGDLYEKPLRLKLYKFLRPEKKFDSLAQLQEEIRKNAEETLAFFENSENFPLLLGKLMI